MSLSSNPAQKTGAFGSGTGILAGRLFGPQFGIVAIGVDAGASALLRSLGNESQRAAGEITKVGQVLGIFGKTLSTSIVALSVTTATVAGAGFAVQGFQQAVAETAAILGKDVREVFERTGKLAVDLSKEFAFSATEIQGAVKQLGQAGQTLSEIEDSLKPVLEFVSATGAEMGDAVDLVVKTLNGFKLEASDTQRVLDSLMFVINTSPTTVNDLQNAFKQLVPVTAQLGISLESTAAAVAAVSRAGLAGSTGGTSLASGLIQLLSPAKAVEEQYGNLINAFRGTLQTTGDLSIAFDAFLREAGTNIQEFEESIDSIKTSEGIKSFEQLGDETLVKLGTRFDVINILLDIFGTRSAKGFLDFSANAQQALVDTVALQLGLAETGTNAEKTIQTIQGQVSILRSQFLAPLLEGDFASTLTEKLEALAESESFERLGEVFANFSDEGLESLIEVMDAALGVIEGATPSLKVFTTALGVIVDIFNVFGDVLGSKVGSVVVQTIIGLKIIKGIFGGLTGEIKKLIQHYTQFGEKQFQVGDNLKKISIAELEAITRLQQEITLREAKLALSDIEMQKELALLEVEKKRSMARIGVLQGAIKSTQGSGSPLAAGFRETARAELKAEELQLKATNAELAVLNTRRADQNGQIAVMKRNLAELTGETVKHSAATRANTAQLNANEAGLVVHHASMKRLALQQVGTTVNSIAATVAFLGVFKVIELVKDGNILLATTLGGLITAYGLINLVLRVNTAAQLANAAATGTAAGATALLQTAMNPLWVIAFGVAVTATIGILAAYRNAALNAADGMATAEGRFDSFKNKLDFFKIEKEFEVNPNQDIDFSFIETVEDEFGRKDSFNLRITLLPPSDEDVRNVVRVVEEMNDDLAVDERLNINLFGRQALDTLEGRIAAAREIIESDVVPDSDKVALASGLVGEAAAKALTQAYANNLTLTDITVQEVANANQERIESGLKRLGSDIRKDAKSVIGSGRFVRDSLDIFTTSISNVMVTIQRAFEDGVLDSQELVKIQSDISKLSDEEQKDLNKLLVDYGITLAELKALQFGATKQQLDIELIKDSTTGAIEDTTKTLADFADNLGDLREAIRPLIPGLTDVAFVNGQYVSTQTLLNNAGIDATESMKALTQITRQLQIFETIRSLEQVFSVVGQELPSAFNTLKTVVLGGLIGQTERLANAWGTGANLQSNINSSMLASGQKLLDAQRQSALQTLAQTRARAVFELRSLEIDRKILEEKARFGRKGTNADGLSLSEVQSEIARLNGIIANYAQTVTETNERFDEMNTNLSNVNDAVNGLTFTFDGKEAGTALSTVLKSLEEATTEVVNGVRVPNEAFKAMSEAGLDVAGALDILRELTIKNQVLSIFTNIANAFNAIGQDLPDGFKAAMREFAGGVANLGADFAKIFDPALFDPTTIGEMWAAAMDSPRFEQNNNIVIRISGDGNLDPSKAAEFADAVITEMNNRQRQQNAR